MQSSSHPLKFALGDGLASWRSLGSFPCYPLRSYTVIQDRIITVPHISEWYDFQWMNLKADSFHLFLFVVFASLLSWAWISASLLPLQVEYTSLLHWLWCCPETYDNQWKMVRRDSTRGPSEIFFCLLFLLLSTMRRAHAREDYSLTQTQGAG